MLVKDLENVVTLAAKDRKIIRQNQDDRLEDRMKVVKSLAEGLRFTCVNTLKDAIKTMNSHFYQALDNQSDVMMRKCKKVSLCRAANRFDLEYSIGLECI